jgi:hypothetical protein
LPEWSPLPPALPGKNFPGGWSQVLSVCGNKRINNHPAESISDTENYHHWNSELDSLNRIDGNSKTDDEIWDQEWKWYWGSWKPRVWQCVCRTKCSWISSANTHVNETGW